MSRPKDIFARCYSCDNSGSERALAVQLLECRVVLRPGRIKTMGIQRVGHVVLKMRDLEKAKSFYQGVLGMKIGAESERGIFFRFGDYHHDIAVFKTGDDADLPKANQVGLVHVALVTDGVETVKAMYERCKARGVEITGSNDHAITNSLYI